MEIVKIDDILNLFDWNNSEEKQQEGLRLASQVECINVFLQPGSLNFGKNVWDNCAIALASRSDEELQPYLGELLEWLMDLNWPGALCILDRLRRYQDKTSLNEAFNKCLHKAKILDDESWEDFLLAIYDDRWG